VVLVVALLTGALVGPAGLTARGVVLELVGALPLVDVDSGLSAQQQAILWQIRLPRVVLGALVGAMLAVAGAAYQGAFRNPLADPYLLGSSVGGGRSTVVIVLAGVAVAAFANAAQTFVQQRYDDSLRAVYAWLLGRLSTDGWHDVLVVLPYVVVSCGVLLLHRRVLDVLAVGDVEAASLGVQPGRVRLALVLAATLGTAAVVSVSGLIGFVGIVVPHAVRLLLGPSHRVLVPVAMVLGAAFLVLTDVLARWVMAPAELPIGVVTAMVGAPFFLVVLRRHRGSW
jgi:iron complex transport system permease protein